MKMWYPSLPYIPKNQCNVVPDGVYNQEGIPLVYSSDHLENNKILPQKVINYIIDSNDGNPLLETDIGGKLDLVAQPLVACEDILHLFKRAETSWRHPDGPSIHLSAAYLFDSLHKGPSKVSLEHSKNSLTWYAEHQSEIDDERG